jgi:hypothetical protein
VKHDRTQIRGKATAKELLAELRKKSLEMDETMKQLNECVAGLSNWQNEAPTEEARWVVEKLEEDGIQSEKKGKTRDYTLFLVGLILSAALGVFLHYFSLT